MYFLLFQFFNFVAFICILATVATARGDAFLAASIGGFLTSFIILLLKIFNIHEKVVLPWPRLEFIFNIIWAVFLLITSALVIDQGPGGYIAGGVSFLYLLFTTRTRSIITNFYK